MSTHAFTWSQKLMCPPRFLWKDPELEVELRCIVGHQGEPIELWLLKPTGLATPAPCFINFHGGGFVFEASASHYRHAMSYAKQAGCIVVFVRYRLAPTYPFPVPQYDCLSAARWVFDHAEELGVDCTRIGIGGDSAGGTLTVTTCLLLQEEQPEFKPLFQLLIYPWLDGRNNSQSFMRFSDVPVWNSRMSEIVIPIINPHPDEIPLAMRSPIEVEDLSNMPPAYIEVAEFDSLHDDGVLYAALLEEQSIEVEFHETYGTIHGFDYMIKAPTTQAMLSRRIAFMTHMFE